MYKTYCGYCGAETGKRDQTSPYPCAIGQIQNTVQHMSTPHFAAFPQNYFEQGKYCRGLPSHREHLRSVQRWRSIAGVLQHTAFPVASAKVGSQSAQVNTGFWMFQGEVSGQVVTLTDTMGHTIQGTMPTATSGGSLGVQFPITCP
jgi:hypothetical protein